MGNKLGCNVSIDQIEELIKNKVDFIIVYALDLIMIYDPETGILGHPDNPYGEPIDMNDPNQYKEWIEEFNLWMKDGYYITVYVKL